MADFFRAQPSGRLTAYGLIKHTNWEGAALIAADAFFEPAIVPGGTTYNETLSESVALSAAQASVATFANARSEAITLAYAVNAAAVYANARSEAVALDSAYTSVQTMLAQIAEQIALADSVTGASGVPSLTPPLYASTIMRQSVINAQTTALLDAIVKQAGTMASVAPEATIMRASVTNESVSALASTIAALGGTLSATINTATVMRATTTNETGSMRSDATNLTASLL